MRSLKLSTADDDVVDPAAAVVLLAFLVAVLCGGIVRAVLPGRAGYGCLFVFSLSAPLVVGIVVGSLDRPYLEQYPRTTAPQSCLIN